MFQYNDEYKAERDAQKILYYRYLNMKCKYKQIIKSCEYLLTDYNNDLVEFEKFFKEY